MAEEKKVGIYVAPSALAIGLVVLLLGLLGYVMKGDWERLVQSNAKQWEVISDLKERVAALEAR